MKKYLVAILLIGFISIVGCVIEPIEIIYKGEAKYITSNDIPDCTIRYYQQGITHTINLNGEWVYKWEIDEPQSAALELWITCYDLVDEVKLSGSIYVDDELINYKEETYNVAPLVDLYLFSSI